MNLKTIAALVFISCPYTLFSQKDFQKKIQTQCILAEPGVAAGKGSGGRLVDILPGDAQASIIWYRMHTTIPVSVCPSWEEI